jgi:hypothetical protein
MRRSEAPDPGWYPDPTNRSRLRWWDGLDWTDIRRAPPSDAELLSFENLAEFQAAHQYTPPAIPDRATSRAESQQIITEVRQAARDEIDRAADRFARQARSMSQEFSPLVSEYTNRIVRWIRFAAIVATVLLVAWFVFQVISQAALFEWIGDRIDNLTDQDGAPLRQMVSGGSAGS